MGYLSQNGQTKQQLVARLTKNEVGTYEENKMLSWECLDYSLRGANLWSVWQKTNSDTGEIVRYIRLDLISYDKWNNGYGYKDMCESMHPYYYDCPLKFLDMAPVSNEEWRDLVIKNHNEAKQKKSKQLKLILALFLLSLVMIVLSLNNGVIGLIIA